jgi:hypothetical protein
VGIGVLSWLTFLLSDRTIGCSTAFARFGGMLEQVFRGDKVKARPYFQKVLPTVGWDTMLIVGIMLGAFISAQLSGEFTLHWIPSLWADAFGSIIWTRVLVALIGGGVLGVGSRWAGGCTSGHGISGTLQLAVSSWLASILFFVGGIITAKLLFSLAGT